MIHLVIADRGADVEVRAELGVRRGALGSAFRSKSRDPQVGATEDQDVRPATGTRRRNDVGSPVAVHVAERHADAAEKRRVERRDGTFAGPVNAAYVGGTSRALPDHELCGRSLRKKQQNRKHTDADRQRAYKAHATPDLQKPRGREIGRLRLTEKRSCKKHQSGRIVATFDKGTGSPEGSRAIPPGARQSAADLRRDRRSPSASSASGPRARFPRRPRPTTRTAARRRPPPGSSAPRVPSASA